MACFGSAPPDSRNGDQRHYVVAGQMSALFTRVAPHDLLDVDAAVMSGSAYA